MKRQQVDGSTARRVALLGDTHGRFAEGVIEALAAYGPDLIVHAGDVGGGEVLSALAGVAPAHAVAGNNDDLRHWQEQDAELLASLPGILDVALPGGRLVVIHGHQSRDARRRHSWLRRQFPEARAVVYGHSHRRVIDEDEWPLVVNPGAAGRARALGGAGWLALEPGRTWRFTEAAPAFYPR